jgi:hypothetical protein
MSVAVAMRATMDRMKRSVFFLGLATGVGLAGPIACRSIDDATPGERVVYPTPPASTAPSPTDGGATPAPAPEVTFSPLDMEIASDCLPVTSVETARPWSQNVPERDCTEDSECGDGHCDRGRCRVIWTCSTRYGQRCIDGQTAPSSQFQARFCRGICLEGRCRSCVSDDECIEKLGMSDAICGHYERDGHRGCGIRGFSYGSPVPTPP